MALSASSAASPPRVERLEGARDLTQLPHSQSAVVMTVRLEPSEARWLRAIGLCEGQQVTVLRCAPFGGPLHVRTGEGGEFALSRELARAIYVVPR